MIDLSINTSIFSSIRSILAFPLKSCEVFQNWMLLAQGEKKNEVVFFDSEKQKDI